MRPTGTPFRAIFRLGLSVMALLAAGCGGGGGGGGGGAACPPAAPAGRSPAVASGGSATSGQDRLGARAAPPPMATATVAAGTSPRSVTVDPSGKYAYVANFNSANVSQYTIGTDG